MKSLERRAGVAAACFVPACLVAAWTAGCLVDFQVGYGSDGGPDRAVWLDADSHVVDVAGDGGGRDSSPDVPRGRDAQGPACGNGIVEAGESCDDGNQESGDGCDATCGVEEYFSCEGSPTVCTCRVLVRAGLVPSTDWDGRTWDTAFQEVQAGIDQASLLLGTLAVARCQVWVAGGTYFVYKRDKSDSISMADGVDILGGFCGTEEQLSERPTDVLGTCPAILDGRDALRRHSVESVLLAQGSGDATVDGVTVQWGGDREGMGGGLRAEGFSVAVRNCLFEGNEAAVGGAIYVGAGSRVVVVDTVFRDNKAREDSGGAVLVASGGHLEVVGDGAGSCRFLENETDRPGEGGAVFVESRATARIAGCTFEGNTAEHGGAVGARGVLDLQASTLGGNVAQGRGGAVHVSSGGDATLEDVTFDGNSADRGGAVTVFSGGGDVRAELRRCSFVDNAAAEASGGLRVDANNSAYRVVAWVSDSLFVGNAGGGFGGAGSAVYGAELHLLNCTVVGNQAGVGGGFLGYRQQAFTVRNSILWDNQGFDLHVYQGNGAPIEVWRSDVQDVGDDVLNRGGLFSANPLFVSGAYHLRATSPCLDRGDDGVVTSTLDLDGNPRTVDLPGVNNGGVVDLGAFERQQP